MIDINFTIELLNAVAGISGVVFFCFFNYMVFEVRHCEYLDNFGNWRVKKINMVDFFDKYI